MKTAKLIFSVILLALFIGRDLFSQNAGDWQTGLTFQPSFFRMIDPEDPEHISVYKPVTPNKFNGLAFGLFGEYGISDHFGIEANLNWSRQEQQYDVQVATITDLDNNVTVLYSSRDTRKRIDYLKLPVLATCNVEIGYGTGLFLKLAAGAQVSYCTNYLVEYTHFNVITHYDRTPIYNTVDYSSWSTHGILSPFNSYYEFKKATPPISDRETEFLMHRLELGVVGGVSLQKTFLRDYSISLGGRFEQGLTSIIPSSSKMYLAFAGSMGTLGDSPLRTRRIALVLTLSRTL